jgi:FAD/FMN-containing dehydrogenase
MAAIPAPPPGFRGSFLTEPRARALYSEGAGPLRIVPAAVALPHDRDDVATLVRYAAAEGLPLIPRGAGTGMPGHNIGPGVVVDLRALDRPARVALTGSANVGAAVTCGVVNKIAAHFGMRFPPDPSSAAWCTVGGMVATNAAGARSLRSGSVRRWVRGIEIVTADGEVGWLPRADARRQHRFPTPAERRELAERLALEDRMQNLQPRLEQARAEVAARFPRTTKNSAGYALDQYLASGDLLDLVIGAEGTLGIVTRVELQLERAPHAVGTLVVALADLALLGGTIELLLGISPSSIELLDRTFLDLAGPDAAPVPMDGVQAVVLVDLEGPDAASVGERLDEADRLVRPRAAATRAGLDPDTRAALWRIRHAASPALAALPDHRRSLQLVEDGCVPVPQLGAYVEGLRAASAELDVPLVIFGHAGDGHLHVNALVDTGWADLVPRLEALLARVTGLVLALGGTPSGEHGDGRLRASALAALYGPAVTALFTDVKRAFDPAGIFNPGVILPTGPALAHLKVGTGAAAVPREVADALRARERIGAWDRPPLTLLDQGA